MLKRVLLTVIIVTVGMVCAARAHATDWFSTLIEVEDRWNLGVSSSVVLPQSDKNLNTGVNVQAMVSYDILKFLAVGAEGGYTWSDIKYESVDLGTAHTFPVLGDVIVKLPLEMGEYTIVPYGIAGFGALFFDIKESGKVSGSMTTDTPVLMKFGGGIDFCLFKNDGFVVALNCEASYHVADVKITGKADGVTLDGTKVDINRSYLGGGLKIIF